MKVRELIETLSAHNVEANVRFSIADDASEDDQERWFAEDGVHACFGDRHPTGGIETETEVTLCLVAESNHCKSAAPLCPSPIEVVREFTAGYVAGIGNDPCRIRFREEDHWIAGWLAGQKDRRVKNAAIDAYLVSVGLDAGSSATPVDRIVIRPRGEKVTIEITAKQADTLWSLLIGEIDRNQFERRTMNTLRQIAKRVDVACGYRPKVDG